VHVEIWSDIACPWCYIGKRRFETALAGYEHAGEVTYQWRSFELDPEAPPERAGDRAEHLAGKYGIPVEQARAMEEQMAERAAADGLTFDFSIARAGNTFDGHRVLQLALEHGVQPAMKERLMRAYFTEGELISDHEMLVRLAGEVGLDGEEVRAVLAGDRYAAEVREDEQLAQRIGIQGVPFFVADRRFGVSGAQPPEVLQEFLGRARAEHDAAA
jgi:predicted DsbA family dithiol-disulfide isomerase